VASWGGGCPHTTAPPHPHYHTPLHHSPASAKYSLLCHLNLPNHYAHTCPASPLPAHGTYHTTRTPPTIISIISTARHGLRQNIKRAENSVLIRAGLLLRTAAALIPYTTAREGTKNERRKVYGIWFYFVTVRRKREQRSVCVRACTYRTLGVPARLPRAMDSPGTSMMSSYATYSGFMVRLRQRKPQNFSSETPLRLSRLCW